MWSQPICAITKTCHRQAVCRNRESSIKQWEKQNFVMLYVISVAYIKLKLWQWLLIWQWNISHSVFHCKGWPWLSAVKRCACYLKAFSWGLTSVVFTSGLSSAVAFLHLACHYQQSVSDSLASQQLLMWLFHPSPVNVNHITDIPQ